MIYNEEDDQQPPVVAVYQTLERKLLNKTKKSKENIPMIINALLKMFVISHAAHTSESSGEKERGNWGNETNVHP